MEEEKIKVIEDSEKKRRKFKIRISGRFIKWMIIIALAVAAFFYIRKKIENTRQLQKDVTVATEVVKKRNIAMRLTGSGVIEPLNQYEVASIVQGEILSANFEVGDVVSKGDILYEISTKDVEDRIESSELTKERAKMNYDEAKKGLNELQITATATGLVRKLYVEEGDTIQIGSQIADIYDDSRMYLDIAFNSAEVTPYMIGQKASIEIEDTFDVLEGVVTEISKIEEVLPGNMLVKKVTIAVKNPGGLTANMTAIATIGDTVCNSAGTFRVAEETTILANKSGKIKNLALEEGTIVSEGSVIITLDRENIDTQLKSNELSIKEADLSLNQQRESLKDYKVKAPISGEVIVKNLKLGDTLNTSTMTKPMAIIYDLSTLTFKMNIDELDILDIKEGQIVTVTADALEGVELEGIVDNISLQALATNGVTQYPVTIHLKEKGDLLPGMNVTGEIVTKQVKKALTIPVDALMRGNKVYVKDPNYTAKPDAQEVTTAPKEAEETAMDPATKGETTTKKEQSDIPEGFYEVEVTTGINDGTYIEVLSGLKKGDEVYIQSNVIESNPLGMYGPGMVVEY